MKQQVSTREPSIGHPQGIGEQSVRAAVMPHPIQARAGEHSIHRSAASLRDRANHQPEERMECWSADQTSTGCSGTRQAHPAVPNRRDFCRGCSHRNRRSPAPAARDRRGLRILGVDAEHPLHIAWACPVRGCAAAMCSACGGRRGLGSSGGSAPTPGGVLLALLPAGDQVPAGDDLG